VPLLLNISTLHIKRKISKSATFTATRVVRDDLIEICGLYSMQLYNPKNLGGTKYNQSSY
jgi:hypothetical protein